MAAKKKTTAKKTSARARTKTVKGAAPKTAKKATKRAPKRKSLAKE